MRFLKTLDDGLFLIGIIVVSIGLFKQAPMSTLIGACCMVLSILLTLYKKK